MFTKSTKRMIIISLLLSFFIVMVQNLYAGFYVIPVNVQKKNIVYVAKTQGDFTDPVAAINSITDASGSNPYVLMIGQGFYTLSEALQMKEYVSIIGSGGVTLVGAFGTNVSNESAVILGADNALLKNLSVVNTGSSTGYSIGLRNDGASPTVIGVTIDVSGGQWNFAIDNRADSTPVFNNVSLYADGGVQAIGIFNFSSDPTLYKGTIQVTDGSSSNYGVYNRSASIPVIAQTTISVSDSFTGAINSGVSGEDNSHASLHNTTIQVTGGLNSYGLYNNTASPALNMVSIEVSGAVNLNEGLVNISTSAPVCSGSSFNMASLDANCD